jgi:hypothetical protein
MAKPELWYSVGRDGECRYQLPTFACTGWSRLSEWARRDLAVDVAEDYHSNHDGWESRWPLDIDLYETEDGPIVARYEVERESVPSFSARELPLHDTEPV